MPKSYSRGITDLSSSLHDSLVFMDSTSKSKCQRPDGHPGEKVVSKRDEYHRHIVGSVINLPRWNSLWGNIYSSSLQDSLNMVVLEMERAILILLLHLGLKKVSPSFKYFFKMHRFTKFNWKHLGSSVNSDVEERCSLLYLSLFFLSEGWYWDQCLIEI